MLEAIVTERITSAEVRDRALTGQAQNTSSAITANNPYKPPTELPANPGKRLQEESHSRWLVVIPTVAVSVGAIVGIVSRLCRPFARDGNLHVETLVAFAILTLSCIVLVIYSRKDHQRLGHVLYQLGNFALWTGFACGWSFVHGYFWDDLVGLSIGGWFCCSLFGSAALLASLINRR